MTNKALLEEITKNVSKLDAHIERLKKQPDQLHEIDIDLLSEKLKEMYSLIHELTAGNPIENTSLSEEEVKASEEPEEVPAPPEPEPVPEPEESSESGVGSSALEEVIEHLPVPNAQPPTPSPQPPAPSSREPVTSDQEPETSDQEPETVEDPEPKTTADLFSGPATIADSFQAEKDNSIAAIVNPQAVKDLKMVIGINDKFLFINELFQGDPSVYNQAIESFNVASGIDEADQSMSAYREQFSWADNSEAYHRLKKIVKSKFNA